MKTYLEAQNKIKNICHIYSVKCVSAQNRIKNICHVYSVKCVSKIKSIISVIIYAIYGTVCFQFTHFSFDDCQNILLHFAATIKSTMNN